MVTLEGWHEWRVHVGACFCKVYRGMMRCQPDMSETFQMRGGATRQDAWNWIFRALLFHQLVDILRTFGCMGGEFSTGWRICDLSYMHAVEDNCIHMLSDIYPSSFLMLPVGANLDLRPLGHIHRVVVTSRSCPKSHAPPFEFSF